MLDGVFSLPKECEKDFEYKITLKKAVDSVIKEYEKLINDVNKEKVQLVINEINCVHDMIVSIFEKYFNGDILSSVNAMKVLIDKYEKILKVSIRKSFAFNFKLPNFNKGLDEIYLFKGRVSNDPYYEYPINEMHHIPLDKRELTTTQRYSIPGVPCLYLAYNSYIAWHEMKNPSLNTFCISAFELLDLDRKILDLTYSYRQIFEYVKERYINDSRTSIFVNIEGVNIEIPAKEAFPYDSQYGLDSSDDNSFLLLASLWPLLVSVSIHCKDKNRTFKSEYVISQLLMYCLGDCIGIAYRSAALGDHHFLPGINLAIPIIKYKNDEKFGDVKDYIKLTDSINVQYFNDFMYRTYKSPKDSDIKASFNKLFLNIANSNTYDLRHCYKNSLFYMLDEYLVNQEFNNIEE